MDRPRSQTLPALSEPLDPPAPAERSPAPRTIGARRRPAPSATGFLLTHEPPISHPAATPHGPGQTPGWPADSATDLLFLRADPPSPPHHPRPSPASRDQSTHATLPSSCPTHAAKNLRAPLNSPCPHDNSIAPPRRAASFNRTVSAMLAALDDRNRLLVNRNGRSGRESESFRPIRWPRAPLAVNSGPRTSEQRARAGPPRTP